MTILEALLDLNKVMAMEGYKSDYRISLSPDDFDRFACYFERHHKHMISYPEMDPRLKEVTWIRIAGPGCYFIVERRK